MNRTTVAALMLTLASCAGSAQEAITVPSTEAPVETTSTTNGDLETTTSSTTTTTPEPTTTSTPPLESLAYVEVTSALEFPIVMKAIPGSDVAWIGTKDGQVWKLRGGELGAAPEIDLSGQIRNSGEQGLLGLEVDPAGENRLWVHYSDNNGNTVVAEIVLLGDGAFEEDVLFTHPQPASNHNGGELTLGPDGALYVGLGDGGAANDRFGHGQNTNSLLGGIVRIDPDAGDTTLWSYGLRNPWRIAFDGNDLYIADVGQNAYEEVNVVAFRPDGYNFGWPITEALHCFSPSQGCDVEGLTLPLVEVEHGDAGTCSITGGVVYRGSEIPELDGHYLYSDFCGGWLRSFRTEGGQAVDRTDWTDQVGIAGSVVSFGVDGSGEVYVLTTERILRLAANR